MNLKSCHPGVVGPRDPARDLIKTMKSIFLSINNNFFELIVTIKFYIKNGSLGPYPGMTKLRDQSPFSKTLAKLFKNSTEPN